MLKPLYFFIRLFLISDNALDRVVKRLLFRHLNRLGGACGQCGQCCRTIGVRFKHHQDILKIWPRLLIGFYKRVYNFNFLGYIEEDRTMLFTCNHFDKEKGRCTIHRFRPAMCRNYPQVRYFWPLELMENCQYKER